MKTSPPSIRPDRHTAAVPRIRRALMAAAALVLPLGASGVATAQPVTFDTLTIIEHSGPGSAERSALGHLTAALEQALDRPVAIEQIADGDEQAAIIDVALGPDDGSRLLVTQMLTRYAFESASADGDLSLRDLTPIAKLTNAISTALVVDADAGFADWAAFRAAGESGALTLCLTPILMAEIPAVMMEAELGVALNIVPQPTEAAVYDCTNDNPSAAGLLPTVSLTSEGMADARALVTFGGGRNLWFPDVPTFREISDLPRDAITGSIGVFGPVGLSPLVARSLTDAFVAAGEAPEVADAVAASGYPLNVSGPDVQVVTLRHTAAIYYHVVQVLQPQRWPAAVQTDTP